MFFSKTKENVFSVKLLVYILHIIIHSILFYIRENVRTEKYAVEKMI